MTEQSITTEFTKQTESVEFVLEKFTGAASVQAVYGTPVQQGEVIVIPSAEVLCAMGFGMGSGSGTDEESQSNGGGGGGGGGGRVFARPVAAIIIEGGHVRVEPVVDVTKIALGLLTTVGFVAGMMWRMSRGRLRV